MMLARLLFASLLVAGAQAKDPNKNLDNVSSKLMIHIPHSLYKDEGYSHREALFGYPPYGGSIAQNVYYADSQLCEQEVDTSGGYPEREKVDGVMKPWPSPYILMVDRAGCTFVQKVRNAQRSGAAGVIIADNVCLCSDDECMKDTGTSTCEATEPIMADDGSGGDISIPSFLMFKHDADKIKEEVKENRPVQVEMSWALPNPDNRVEYDLWSVPNDPINKEFFKNFKSVAKALGDRAYFTPHMYIHDGVRSHCQGNDGDNWCYTLCTNNGRYCATDPDNDLDGGVSGADIVKESLRRLCIWSKYGATDGIGEKFWNYVTEFIDRCSSNDYFNDDDCIKDAYKHAKVDGKDIERCMIDSGGVDADTPNAKLDIEISLQASRGVVIVPTAFVNNAVLRGALSVGTMFRAICAGYSEGSMPEVCQKCSGCQDVPGCAEAGYCKANRGGSSGEGVSTHTFGVSMLFVIALFSGLGAWHYKRTQEDMRDQVRGILAEYMPLEDNDGGNGNGNSPMDFARGGATTSFLS